MPKTLLAVDDSVTMRKVLEITFSGEDFRVITAENAQNALGKLSENPSVLLVDAVLGGEDGYALAKELRKRSPQAAIILLSSRYAPYDQSKGRDAGVDDWADKPFDTQQLIDKIRKVVLAKEAAPPAPVAIPAAAPTPAKLVPQAPAAPPPPAPTAGNLGRSTQQSLGGASPARSGTLIFGEGMGAPVAVAPAAPSAPRPVAPPAPVASVPAVSTAAISSAPPAVAHAPSPIAAATAAASSDLADKLHGLGLTQAQADAVLSLSRDVVERVVWEVVPQLAETLIKEEIARLTR